MQGTSISLLTRDGGIRATFTPALTSEQYATLLEAIKHDADTMEEMSGLLKKLGKSWGCEVLIDPC